MIMATPLCNKPTQNFITLPSRKEKNKTNLDQTQEINFNIKA